MTLLKLIRPCLFSVCCILVSTSGVQAQSTESSGAEAETELQLQVGLAVSANTSFYRGVGEEFYLFPLVIAEYDRFYLQGTHGGYRFYQSDSGQVWSLEIRRTFDGFSGDDADYLNGLSERKAAWEAGIALQMPLAGGEVKGKLMQDISGSHEGFSSRLEYERPAYIDTQQLLTWYVGAEYWDSDKTHYYFGVSEDEVSARRPGYQAGGSQTGFVGTNYFRTLAPDLTLFVSGEYLVASSDIEDSPLTERGDQWSAYSGLFYHF